MPRQIRRGTASGRVALGGLSVGELGFETDARSLYIGSSVGDIRIHGDYITPEMYWPNTIPGTTDMATAIQAAIDVAYAAGGGRVLLKATTYLVGSSLVPRSGVMIEGCYPQVPSTTLAWDLGFYLDGGTVITSPGNIVFQQDLSGAAGTAMHLTGFELRNLGFKNCAGILACGDTDKVGIGGGLIENIAGEDITGTAFSIGNTQHLNMRFIMLTNCNQGLDWFNDCTGTHDLFSTGNSLIQDFYLLQNPTAGLTNHGVLFRCKAGNVENLNNIEVQHLQVNRFNVGAKQMACLALIGNATSWVVNHSFTSLDLEGPADSAILAQYAIANKFHIATSNPNLQNYLYRAATAYQNIVEAQDTSTVLYFDDDTSADGTEARGQFGSSGQHNRKAKGFYWDQSRVSQLYQGYMLTDSVIKVFAYDATLGENLRFVNGGHLRQVKSVSTTRVMFQSEANAFFRLDGDSSYDLTLWEYPSTTPGAEVVFKKVTGTGTVTLKGTIDGVADMAISGAGKCVTLWCDGVEWKVKSIYTP